MAKKVIRKVSETRAMKEDRAQRYVELYKHYQSIGKDDDASMIAAYKDVWDRPQITIVKARNLAKKYHDTHIVQEIMIGATKEIARSVAQNITRDGIIAELVNIAKASPRDFQDWTGREMHYKSWSDIPENLHRCVQSADPVLDRYGNLITLKIRFYSRMEAIDRLIRVLGFDASDRAREEEIRQRQMAIDAMLSNLPEEQVESFARLASSAFKMVE